MSDIQFIFTIEKKAKKFDEIIAKHEEFKAYRYNLAMYACADRESYTKEHESKPGTISVKEVGKRLDVLKKLKIQEEIDRVDVILSFLSQFLDK